MRSVLGRARRAGLVLGAAGLLAACGTTVDLRSAQSPATGTDGLDVTTQPGAATAAGGASAAAGASTGSAGAAVGGSTVTGATTTRTSRSGAVITSPSARTGGTVPVPAVGGDRQGITSTTIRIGFVGLDPSGQAETNAAFGETTPPANTKDAMSAVVKWANAHGGIAGRKIVPYYVERNNNSQDPNHAEAICSSMTEDGKVFAVVSNYSGDAEPCYVKHHTLLLDDSNYFARDALGAWNPYVWSPGLGSREGGFRAMVDSLQGQGYFNGKVKLGIVMFDDAATKYEFNVAVKPTLDRLGLKPELAYVTSDGGTDQFTRESQAAELRFSQDHVDHVMFMAGGGLAPLVFMNSAETQLYRPRYGLSSIDSPAFLLQGKAPDAQLHNAVGAGYSEIVDVDASRGDPYPTGPAEKKCYQILKAAGLQSHTRAGAFGGEFICDGVFMLQAAGAGLEQNLSVQTWAANAERLGRTFQASYSLPNGTAFHPGLRGGGIYYRFLKFVDSCRCFQYVSGNRPIPDI